VQSHQSPALKCSINASAPSRPLEGVNCWNNTDHLPPPPLPLLLSTALAPAAAAAAAVPLFRPCRATLCTAGAKPRPPAPPPLNPGCLARLGAKPLLLPGPGLTTTCSRSEAARVLRGLGSRVADSTSLCDILNATGGRLAALLLPPPPLLPPPADCCCCCWSFAWKQQCRSVMWRVPSNTT
jgi:hypothetical protein